MESIVVGKYLQRKVRALEGVSSTTWTATVNTTQWVQENANGNGKKAINKIGETKLRQQAAETFTLVAIFVIVVVSIIVTWWLLLN